MKKILALLALGSLSAVSCLEAVREPKMQSRGKVSSEDRTEIGRLEAELRAAEQQVSQGQRKVAQLREQIARLESESQVRAANAEQRTYRGNGEMESEE